MNYAYMYAPIITSDFIVQPYTLENQIFKIKYEIPFGTPRDAIAHIQLKISSNTNNMSIIKDNNNDAYYGIKYKPVSNDSTVTFSLSDLNYSSINDIIGQVYKIQLRFGFVPACENSNNFNNWYAANLNNFSEWSTVVLFKLISLPDIDVKVNTLIESQFLPEVNKNLFISIKENTINSIYPSCSATCKFNTASTEHISKYKFSCKKRNEANNYIDSGWIQNTDSNQTIFTYQIVQSLEADTEYELKFVCETQNGFSVQKSVFFHTSENMPLSEEIPNILTIKENYEYAYYSLYLNKPPVGSYILLKSSSFDNYATWCTLGYIGIDLNSSELNNLLIFNDYDISGNDTYKYRLVQYAQNAIVNEIIATVEPKQVFFEHVYLLADNKQLTIKFNPKVSSYKKNTLISKNDTLGSKFPIITKNGNTYYSEFSISGLISYHMNEHQQLSIINIPNRVSKLRTNTSSKQDDSDNLSNNLISDNINKEKQFRDDVIQFLNDGKPKLFKSMTEGNQIVMLTNVSFTPNDQLGRMLYEFSATAVEIADYNFNNVTQLKLQNMNYWLYGNKNSSEVSTYTVHGQISGIFSNNSNSITTLLRQKIHELLKAKIKNLQENQYLFDEGQVLTLWVDDYPILPSDNRKYILHREYLDAIKKVGKSIKNKTDDLTPNDIQKIDTKINFYNNLINTTQNSLVNYHYKKLNINSQTFLIRSGEIYQINCPINVLDLEISSQNDYLPLTLNFTYKTDVRTIQKNNADRSNTYIGVNSVSGMFSNQPDILSSIGFFTTTKKYDYEPLIPKLNTLAQTSPYYYGYKTDNLTDIIYHDMYLNIITKMYPNRIFIFDKKNLCWKSETLNETIKIKLIRLEDVTFDGDKGTQIYWKNKTDLSTTSPNSLDEVGYYNIKNINATDLQTYDLKIQFNKRAALELTLHYKYILQEEVYVDE